MEATASSRLMASCQKGDEDQSVQLDVNFSITADWNWSREMFVKTGESLKKKPDISGCVCEEGVRKDVRMLSV